MPAIDQTDPVQRRSLAAPESLVIKVWRCWQTWRNDVTRFSVSSFWNIYAGVQRQPMKSELVPETKL